MKKIVVAALVLILAGTSMVFAGAGRQDGAGAAGGKKRVVYIARAQADLFAAWLANSIKTESAKYPNLDVQVLDGQADDAKQNGLIETAIANKADIIILQPNDAEAQKPSVQKAVDAKIPVILTNPRIPDEAFMKITNSVDANPYEQAALVARLALTQIPQDGKVVVLRGPDGNMHSVERRRAWETEFFAKRPDVTIVGEQSGHWNKDEGMRYMEDWVQANPQIDAVCSMNDNMAMGALEAVKGNAKFANLLVYGVDGDAAAALLIEEGSFTATTFQNADELAKQNLKLANDILTGVVTGVVNTDIVCPLYTKDNVAELIAIHKSTGALK
jgi:inositol transport system substrate-binding protein